MEGRVAGAQQAQQQQQAAGLMDTLLSLIPGRKAQVSSEPSDDSIKRTHDFLRCSPPSQLCRGCCNLHIQAFICGKGENYEGHSKVLFQTNLKSSKQKDVPSYLNQEGWPNAMICPASYHSLCDIQSAFQRFTLSHATSLLAGPPVTGLQIKF